MGRVAVDRLDGDVDDGKRDQIEPIGDGESAAFFAQHSEGYEAGRVGREQPDLAVVVLPRLRIEVDRDLTDPVGFANCSRASDVRIGERIEDSGCDRRRRIVLDGLPADDGARPDEFRRGLPSGCLARSRGSVPGRW